MGEILLSAGDQNTRYYDHIADEYDELLKKDPQNTAVRQKVEKLFKQFVPDGIVLDFGGGTGQDLPWMQYHGYRVYFCEPSPKMRELAQAGARRPESSQIVFLDDAQANFVHWRERRPFQELVDGILSNFAVLNSIADIHTAFASLSSVLMPGGHLLALVLDGRRTTLIKKHTKAFLKSILSSRPVTLKIHHKEFSHTVYLHSFQQLKKAAGPFFIVDQNPEFAEFGFILLHFIKK